MGNTANAPDEIRRNARIHDRIAREYEKNHGEIFNAVEQRRVRERLALAVNSIRRTPPFTALDFGAGTGNLSRHLIALGVRTTAADVSTRSLELLRDAMGTSDMLDTHVLNGRDLAGVANNSFDLVTAYSVIHHIPDYHTALREMCRVLRSGGVLYIDHEMSPDFWKPWTKPYMEFRAATAPRKTRRRVLNLLRPRWYVDRLRLLLNPRYQKEGDIHVWPDDHIEWDEVIGTIAACGGQTVLQEDYLLCRAHYPLALYQRYAQHCHDARLLISRKRT